MNKKQDTYHRQYTKPNRSLVILLNNAIGFFRKVKQSIAVD